MTLQLDTTSEPPSARTEQEETRSAHFCEYCWGGSSLAFSVWTVNSMSTYVQTPDIRGVRGK